MALNHGGADAPAPFERAGPTPAQPAQNSTISRSEPSFMTHELRGDIAAPLRHSSWDPQAFRSYESKYFLAVFVQRDPPEPLINTQGTYNGDDRRERGLARATAVRDTNPAPCAS